MDSAELEKTLAELEEKIDRVRALYEQYFVGVEKLEPQIPRKDVDRLLIILRKQQIRNTALKFKFQTLVQRFNTMQQHWGRTMREIENGTYRRDVLKAAARFGVDDALTAVGKKRAKGLQSALEKQRDRENARGGGGGAERRVGNEYQEADSVDVDMDDDFDDDAPTPPPVVVRPRVYAIDAEVTYDPSADDGSRHHDPHAAPTHPVDVVGYAPRSAAPPPIAPGPMSQPPPSVDGKKSGGLRLGGGPSRRADPEALARLAALSDGGGRKPLLSQPLDIGLPDSEPPPAPVPPAPRAVAPDAAARKPLLSSPLDIDIGDEPTKTGDAESAAASTRSEVVRVAAIRADAARAEARDARRNEAAKNPPPSDRPEGKRSFGDLNDGRLREIYGQYVQARRERNESTAGITFEKLAESLRTQADKLKTKHTSKRVDYEVVVKDGKTLIKPIVK